MENVSLKSVDSSTLSPFPIYPNLKWVAGLSSNLSTFEIYKSQLIQFDTLIRLFWLRKILVGLTSPKLYSKGLLLLPRLNQTEQQVPHLKIFELSLLPCGCKYIRWVDGDNINSWSSWSSWGEMYFYGACIEVLRSALWLAEKSRNPKR